MSDLLLLREVATKLRCSIETVRKHAPTIPGAFKGPGGWRFPANIVELMQNARGPALRTQEEVCQSASGEGHGGSTSPRQTEAELDEVLARLTRPPRKNSTIA